MRCDAAPWSSFGEIVRAGDLIWDIGRLTLRCGFEEKHSTQDKRGYDVVSLKLSGRRLSFCYYANGSHVGLSLENALALMTRSRVSI